MLAQKNHRDINCECPSCQTASRFEHIGSQQYPEAVARKLNLPSKIEIFRCGHCFTTLTNIQLKQLA